MSDYEQSVDNLRTFVGLLLEVKPRLQETAGELETSADDLDRLEGTADTQLEAFDDALDHFDQELADGSQAALAQIDKVDADARDIAGTRLDEGARNVDGAEGEFENILRVGRDDLEKDSTSLSEGGFQVLTTVVANVQQAVDTSRQEAEASFQGFDGVVQGFQGEADTRFDTGGQAADNAVTALGQEGTDVTSEAGQSEQAMQDEARALEGECTGIENGVDTSYQEQMEKVEKAGQDLIDSVDTLAEDTAGFVATSSGDQVDAPIGLVMADAMPPLEAELGTLATMLGEGEQTTAEVDPLTQDLEKSMRVVATIDELLKAMN